MFKPTQLACAAHCIANSANACEWNQNGSCFVEFGNSCGIQGGFAGWWAEVFNAGNGSSSLSISFNASNGQYVVAENGGGDVVNANRSAVGPWETFTLIDLNGGGLRDGDPVGIQAVGGQYLQAVYGGGDTMRAVGPAIGSWETFTLIDLDRPGGAVQQSDAVALRTSDGHYVVAELGGGDVVNANRTAIGAWETFHIVIH